MTDHRDKALAYIKHLMLIADEADGDLNGKIDKTTAKKAVDTLIARAEQIGCPEEMKHLRVMKAALETIREDVIDSPYQPFVPTFLINKKLSEAMKKTEPGRALLAWYDVDHGDCDRKMDYNLSRIPQKKGDKSGIAFVK